MKILAILLLRSGNGEEPTQLAGSYYLDDFNFFQKEGYVSTAVSDIEKSSERENMCVLTPA